MMISTLFECTCCKSPNGNDVATKERHFESFESKYSFKLLLLGSAEFVLHILMQGYEEMELKSRQKVHGVFLFHKFEYDA